MTAMVGSFNVDGYRWAPDVAFDREFLILLVANDESRIKLNDRGRQVERHLGGFPVALVAKLNGPMLDDRTGRRR